MSDALGAAGWTIAVWMSFAWLIAKSDKKLYQEAYESMLANVKWWEKFHAESMLLVRDWQKLYEDAKRKQG